MSNYVGSRDYSKIIFLDIDGVLNSVRSFYAMYREKEVALDELFMTCIPHKMHLRHLQKIVDETHAVCVISSTWRKSCSSMLMWTCLFQALGFEIPVIGTTPILDKKRGHEIQAWIDERNNDASKEWGARWYHFPVEKFVILDDDGDMVHLMDNLVQTDNHLGLTEIDSLKAIEMLNTEKQ